MHDSSQLSTKTILKPRNDDCDFLTPTTSNKNWFCNIQYEFPNQVTCSSTNNTSNDCKIQNKQEQEKSFLKEQLIYILPYLDSKVLG